jgi:hypothetical protein
MAGAGIVLVCVGVQLYLSFTSFLPLSSRSKDVEVRGK